MIAALKDMELLFPRRIARVSYLCRTVALVVVAGLLVAFGVESRMESDRIEVRDLAAALVLLGYWLFFIILPRCRDLAMSGWFTLLVFVPGVDIFFCSYLAWGRTKVRPDWGHSAPPTHGNEPATSAPSPGLDPVPSTALIRLESLRASGVITDTQFERMKAQRGL
jgi:hypothetical protein